jgi:predicted MFS family arabinose efflux permease
MGPVFVYSRWFPADRLATFTGLQVSIGGVGTLLATAPLAFAAATIGWRGAFYIAAAATTIVAVAVAFLVVDTPGRKDTPNPQTESLVESLVGVVEIFRNRQTPLLFAMQFTGYACFISVLGLWGAPYLTDVHGLSQSQAGEILFMMALAIMAAQALWGPIDRVLNSRKKPVIAGAILTAGLLAILGLWPSPPVWAAASLLIILGLVGGYTPIVLVHGRFLFPERLAARGMTTLNMGVMLGVSFFQSVSGVVIGRYDLINGAYPEIAYRSVFGLLSVSLFIAVAIYAFSTDAKPNPKISR